MGKSKQKSTLPMSPMPFWLMSPSSATSPQAPERWSTCLLASRPDFAGVQQRQVGFLPPPEHSRTRRTLSSVEFCSSSCRGPRVLLKDFLVFCVRWISLGGMCSRSWLGGMRGGGWLGRVCVCDMSYIVNVNVRMHVVYVVCVVHVCMHACMCV